MAGTSEVPNNRIITLPTPQVGTESLIPPDDHTAPSWTHTEGVDMHAGNEARKRWADIAAASISRVQNAIKLEIFRNRPVWTEENNGKSVLLKFDKQGRIIRESASAEVDASDQDPTAA